MIEKGYEEEYAKAVMGYIVIKPNYRPLLSSIYLSTLGKHIRTCKAPILKTDFPMLWDFVEVNPFSDSSGILVLVMCILIIIIYDSFYKGILTMF